MGRLRLYDRLQQINCLSRPVRQTAPTDLDAAVLQPLVLPIQWQVIAELVDQHRRQETHIHRTLLQHVRCRRCSNQLPRVATLYHLSNVLQYPVTTRFLRQSIAHFLGNDLSVRFRDRRNLRVRDMNRSNRHRSVKAQTTVVDGRRTLLLTALVGDLLGGNRILLRWGLNTQAEQ